MSKIEFDQINDNEVEVVIPPETPLSVVLQLAKSFTSRGLVEDLRKSTLSVRYFYRVSNKANDVADELIKSLERMSGLEKAKTEMDKLRFETQRKSREIPIADRQAKNGIVPPTVAPTPQSIPNTGPVTLTGGPNKLDNTYAASTPLMNTKKSENNHVDGCQCTACLEMKKSGYGPKTFGAYNPADNAKRKANNTSTQIAGIGPNRNVKALSTKPGQLSGKQSADLTARIQNTANKRQPVKTLSPEEIEAQYGGKKPLVKSWGQHLPFPSAEEEVMKHVGAYETGEEVAANQLANLMAGKSMLGDNVPASIKARFAAPPAQPTDQQLFGHLVVTEEMVKAKEQEWQQGAFGWLAEAQKPISQKFTSEADEAKYWASIKVSDRDDGSSGY